MCITLLRSTTFYRNLNNQHKNTMKLKVILLCLVVFCIFSHANAKHYQDEHTLPSDSQELIITYMKRAHAYREHLNWMCSGFDFGNQVVPGFNFEVDYNYWYDLCWKFEYIWGYFPKFMKPHRARIIKEVREEFKKMGKH